MNNWKDRFFDVLLDTDWKAVFYTVWNDPLVVCVIFVVIFDFMYRSCSG